MTSSHGQIPCTKYIIDPRNGGGFRVLEMHSTMPRFQTIENQCKNGEGVVKIWRNRDGQIPFPKKKKRGQNAKKQPDSARQALPRNPTFAQVADFQSPMETAISLDLPEFSLHEVEKLGEMSNGMSSLPLLPQFNLTDYYSNETMMFVADEDQINSPPANNMGIYENLSVTLDNPSLAEMQWERLCSMDARVPYTTIKSICTHEEWVKLGKVRMDTIVCAGSWAWNNLMMRFIKIQNLAYDFKTLSHYTGSGNTRCVNKTVYVSVEVFLNAMRGWDTMMGMHFVEDDPNEDVNMRLYMRFLACMYWNLRDQLIAAGFLDWGSSTPAIPPFLLEAAGFAKAMENLHRAPDAKMKFNPLIFIHQCNAVWQSNVVLGHGNFVSPYQIVMKIIDDMGLSDEKTFKRKTIDMLLCVAWSDMYFAWNSVDVSIALIHCIIRAIALDESVENKDSVVEMGRNIIQLACGRQPYDAGGRVARTRALSHEIMYIYMNNKRLIAMPFLKDPLLC